MKNKVDQINDAFMEVLTKENAKSYTRYIKSINKELVANIENLTPAKVREIVQSAKINVDDIALLFMIQNIVLLIVGKQLTKKQKVNYASIIAVVGAYSLKKPKKFVERIVRINKGKGLNSNEKKIKILVDNFKAENVEELSQAIKSSRKTLDRVRIKSKLSKNMIKDLKEGLKEQKSIARIKKEVLAKNNKLTNVERTLNTELHAQSEQVRKEFSESIGFTHKTWKTQGDVRVRSTHFHNGVTNKRVPIDSDFRAGGLKAQYPGDDSLPPSDRIRCRCYLIYD